MSGPGGFQLVVARLRIAAADQRDRSSGYRLVAREEFQTRFSLHA
jgi:hypothetical protein